MSAVRPPFPLRGRGASATGQVQAFAGPGSMSRAGRIFIAVMLLIIFEGAIRKWISTGITLQLILLRDLLVIWLVLHAWLGGYLKRQKQVTRVMLGWSCVVFAWGLLQVAAGESSPVLLIIGLRFWLLYYWFAVAAAAAMNERDFRTALLIAGFTMLLLGPLAVLQHFSPPGAFINAQTDGGDEAAIFQVVEGVVRTTGTFSFTAGYSYFMTMVAPVVLGLLAARKRKLWQRLFVLAVFGAFVAGTLVSGSRTAVISSGFMFGAFLLGRVLFAPRRERVRALIMIVVSLALVGILALFFQEAIQVTQTRFETAAEVEPFWGRIQLLILGEPGVVDVMSWLGAGIGVGSNLANFVRTGSTVFTLAETESGRILLEGGVLGAVFVAMKALVLVAGLLASLRLSARIRSPLPTLMWLALAVAMMTWSAIGQLTANGMLGVSLALALLILRHPQIEIFPPRKLQS